MQCFDTFFYYFTLTTTIDYVGLSVLFTILPFFFSLFPVTKHAVIPYTFTYTQTIPNDTTPTPSYSYHDQCPIIPPISIYIYLSSYFLHGTRVTQRRIHWVGRREFHDTSIYTYFLAYTCILFNDGGNRGRRGRRRQFERQNFSKIPRNRFSESVLLLLWLEEMGRRTRGRVSVCD